MDVDEMTRGAFYPTNGDMVVDTPKQEDQMLASECPHCGFLCVRLMKDNGERFCASCFETTPPAYMAG